MQRDLPSHNTAKKRKGKLWLEGWPSVSRRGSNSPFLELRDHSVTTVFVLQLAVWGTAEEKQVTLFLWCLIQQAERPQFKMLLWPCALQSRLRREQKSPPHSFPWHCVFYSSAETATALLLNLSPYWHQNSLKRQRNTSKRINCIRQYFSLSNHLPYVHSLQYVS